MNDRLNSIYAQIQSLRQELAELRRSAAPEPVENLTLLDLDGAEIALSDLFGDKDDLIVVHNMGKGCVYCTMWADGFNGEHEHLSDRAAFVLCSADPPDVAREFARARDWGYRVVSGHETGFAAALDYESAEGQPMPGASVFHRNADGSIVRTGHAPFGPGDDFCAVWPLFDMLKDGADGWSPKYTYS